MCDPENAANINFIQTTQTKCKVNKVKSKSYLNVLQLKRKALKCVHEISKLKKTI